MNITIIGYYGGNNWGDDKILKEIINFLNKSYKTCRIRVLSPNPKNIFNM